MSEFSIYRAATNNSTITEMIGVSFRKIALLLKKYNGLGSIS